MTQYHQVPTITSIIKYQTVAPYSDQIPPVTDYVHGFTTLPSLTASFISSPSHAQFSLLLQLFIAFFEDKFILFIAFVLRLMRTNILANAGAEMTSPPGAVAQMCSNIYHIMGYTLIQIFVP